jgi:hypothetical protein
MASNERGLAIGINPRGATPNLSEAERPEARLLVNFNVPVLKLGSKRIANRLPEQSSALSAPLR